MHAWQSGPWFWERYDIIILPENATQLVLQSPIDYSSFTDLSRHEFQS